MLFYDYIIFQRDVPCPASQFLVFLLGKKVYFDLDDALYLNPPPKNNKGVGMEAQENPILASRIRLFTRKCSGIIVCNDYLKSWMEKINSQVKVVPTACPVLHDALTRRKISHAQAANKIIIGWMGAVENQLYLMWLKTIFERLFTRYPDIELHVITKKHWDFKLSQVRNIDWHPETYQEHVNNFTIGIAPLMDDAWTRGKMQFKALQYMAQVVPVIASPIGMPVDRFKHNKNILFASNEEEWFIQIERLLFDQGLQERLGLNGYQTVERFYSVAALGSSIADFLISSRG